MDIQEIRKKQISKIENLLRKERQKENPDCVVLDCLKLLLFKKDVDTINNLYQKRNYYGSLVTKYFYICDGKWEKLIRFLDHRGDSLFDKFWSLNDIETAKQFVESQGWKKIR